MTESNAISEKLSELVRRGQLPATIGNTLWYMALADSIAALESRLEAAEAPPPVDATSLARLFHATYERLAPSFGYKTRTDTREFDPESNNGRLMIAVCGEVLGRAEAEKQQAVDAALESVGKELLSEEPDPENPINSLFVGGWDAAARRVLERIGQNPLADAQRRIAELEAEQELLHRKVALQKQANSLFIDEYEKDKQALADAQRRIAELGREVAKVYHDIDMLTQSNTDLQSRLERATENWDDLLEDLELEGRHQWEPYKESKAKFKAMFHRASDSVEGPTDTCDAAMQESRNDPTNS